MTNSHDVEDEDDLFTRKEKSARAWLRKMNSGGGLGSHVDALQNLIVDPSYKVSNGKGFEGT